MNKDQIKLEELERQLRSRLEEKFRLQLGDLPGNQPGNYLYDQLFDQLWNELGMQLWDQSGSQITIQLENERTANTVQKMRS